MVPLPRRVIGGTRRLHDAIRSALGSGRCEAKSGLAIAKAQFADGPIADATTRCTHQREADGRLSWHDELRKVAAPRDRSTTLRHLHD